MRVCFLEKNLIERTFETVPGCQLTDITNINNEAETRGHLLEMSGETKKFEIIKTLTFHIHSHK